MARFLNKWRKITDKSLEDWSDRILSLVIWSFRDLPASYCERFPDNGVVDKMRCIRKNAQERYVNSTFKCSHGAPSGSRMWQSEIQAWRDLERQVWTTWKHFLWRVIAFTPKTPIFLKEKIENTNNYYITLFFKFSILSFWTYLTCYIILSSLLPKGQSEFVAPGSTANTMVNRKWTKTQTTVDKTTTQKKIKQHYNRGANSCAPEG